MPATSMRRRTLPILYTLQSYYGVCWTPKMRRRIQLSLLSSGRQILFHKERLDSLLVIVIIIITSASAVAVAVPPVVRDDSGE